MMTGHQELVATLVKEGILKSKDAIKAMLAVDRKYYAPKYAYQDSPQSLGYGATISAPHMHAYALEHLADKLVTAKNVLDVGSGTGYLTAAMAIITPPNCKVYGIEHVPQLVKSSLKNISQSNPELLSEKKVIIQVGDGREGWSLDPSLQFDVIHVGAAPKKMPAKLLEQLAEGGKMVIPVGSEYQGQKFLQIVKNNGEIKQKTICGVRYVPLTDLKQQLSSI